VTEREERFDVFRFKAAVANVVALDWQNADEVREYANRHDLAVPVLLGTRETARDWGISAFPTYYIVDSEQRVTHGDYGYSTLAGLWLRTAFVH